MQSSYKRIGDYITLVDERNVDLEVTTLLGLSISKQFIPSVANIIGTNMRNYKIIRKNQFACSVMQVRRDGKMPVALLRDFEEAIISQAYSVFEVVDRSLLLPEYLMMWFTRSEFDRQATFHAVGGVRGSLEWEDFMDFELPVPSIETQQEIVNEYHTITNRIQLNEQLNQKLEETAQTLYKHWFVDFEFPCLPSDYRPHGQVNLKITVDELKNEITKVCTYKRMGGVPIPDRRSWFVYLILCEDNSIYKGMTNDLYRRFYEHYTGQGAKHTKQHKPVKLIHWEQFESKEAAAKRENELKTGYGRTWINRQIEKAGDIVSLKRGLPAPTTKLRMAGVMVYDEELDGEVPEGWEMARIEDIAKLRYGKMLDSELFLDEGYPVYSGYGIRGYYHKYMYELPQILVLCRGVSGTGEVRMSPPYAYITNLSIVVENDINLVKKEFLYFYLRNDNLRSLDSGSAQSQITINDLGFHKVLIPFRDIQELFTGKIEEITRYLNIDKILKLQELSVLLLSKMATVRTEEEIVIN